MRPRRMAGTIPEMTVDQRRLAGVVGAEQAHEFALADMDRHVAQITGTPS